MAIDKLQEKIRKMKNPSAISFSYDNGNENYEAQCIATLESLKDIVPAVRFCFCSFALFGKTELLQSLMKEAKKYGFYVLLDGPELWSVAAAEQAANLLFGTDSYGFDGIVLSAYCGSEMAKPFIAQMGEKDVFIVIRSANKSASELQDLLTGGRLVHTAAADVVNRLGENFVTRCGYAPVGAVASATAGDSLRNLRAKYKSLFLLVDGYGLSGANGKNCSLAFDRLGHGALVCGAFDLTEIVQNAEKMKTNLSHYISVL